MRGGEASEAISRKSRLPVYSQIRQHLEQDIREKKLSPGERLPSEDDLAERYGASRMTVRRAIDQLVSQGRLKRVQGKGTFVLDQPVSAKAAGVTRWTIERISLDEQVRREVMLVEDVPPTLRVANLLHTMPGEPIVEITTVLYLQCVPLGYNVTRIPKLLVPAIEDWTLGNEVVTQFIQKRCGFKFGKVEERVRAVPAGEDVAEVLQLDPGSPMLYIDSLIYLTSGIPVILADTTYRGDQFVYTGLLTPVIEP